MTIEGIKGAKMVGTGLKTNSYLMHTHYYLSDIVPPHKHEIK